MSLTALLPPLAGLLAMGDRAPAQAMENLTRAWQRDQGCTGRSLECLTRGAAGRRGLHWLERRSIPGLLAHFEWRKRWIAARAMERLADDGQLLVLGAGFDDLGVTTALRLPRCHVFELDRKRVMESKRRQLSVVRGIPGNWNALAVDFASRGRGLDWGSRLRLHARWRPGAHTVVVAEGLLMYLPPTIVDAMLQTLEVSTSGDVHLIATAMDVRDNGAAGFRAQAGWIGRLMHGVGERFEWGLERRTLDKVLAHRGVLETRYAEDDDAMPVDPCPGEHLFIARLGRLRTSARERQRPSPGRTPIRRSSGPRSP